MPPPRRTFPLPEPSSNAPWTPCTIQPRGVSVMAIEFLTNYPASECVVTRGDLPLWNCVFDLFPKTLFHAFSHFSLEDLRPNVIRHGAPFSAHTAARFSQRGTQYNVIFCGESMAAQDELYKCGRPSVALMWITESGWGWFGGELVYPVHCSPSSSLCALVPSQWQPHLKNYSGLGWEMRRFQASARHPGSSYDRDVETEVLLAHARVVSEISEPSVARLMLETVRLDLPREGEPELVFSSFSSGHQALQQPIHELLGQVEEEQPNSELPGHVAEWPHEQEVHGGNSDHLGKATEALWTNADVESLLALFMPN